MTSISADSLSSRPQTDRNSEIGAQARAEAAKATAAAADALKVQQTTEAQQVPAEAPAAKAPVDPQAQADARRVSQGSEAAAAQRLNQPRTSTPAPTARPTTALASTSAAPTPAAAPAAAPAPATTPQTQATQAPTTLPATSMSRPGVTDVGHMAPGELDRLKRSTDPADRRRATTIERAQSAYKDHMAAGGRVLVGTSAGNGNHPVVTLLPPGFDPSKPAKVQTHYHGFNATVADGANHSSGTTRAIAEAQRRDPQAVFVLPEAGNARPGAYATDWSNVRSQAQTTNDALRDAGVQNVGERVVSAHSGGGAALQRAMQANPNGSGVQADRVVLHDSLYGSQNAVAQWGNTPAGRNAQLTYVHGSNDAGRDAVIKRAFGDRFGRIDVRGNDAHNRSIFEHLQGR